MPNITLTYFDLAASRGEECRLALHLAGVPFTDERLNRADFAARKPKLPFGSLPVLTVEGHPPLAQSNTILRLIGREHGLHPTDPWAAAREEAVMESIEDMRHHMRPLARIKDEAEKKRAREEAANGYLQDWAGYIERQIEGPFVGGREPHVVDLKIFVALEPYLKGTIDFVPTDVWKAFPKLLGVHAAVRQHPKVQSWYAR
jgi:prostaglandin-H2 D-isomerase / glutathione transferase